MGMVRIREIIRRIKDSEFNEIPLSLKQNLRNHDFDIVLGSKNSLLETILRSTNNPIEQMVKSKIYGIPRVNGRKVYIGQTRRNVGVALQRTLKGSRIGEKKGASAFRSKDAEHIILNKNRVSREEIRRGYEEIRRSPRYHHHH